MLVWMQVLLREFVSCELGEGEAWKSAGHKTQVHKNRGEIWKAGIFLRIHK